MRDHCVASQQAAEAFLAAAALRPTHQRVSLTRIMLSPELRHFTVESVFQRAAESDSRVALATVYNLLKLFKEKGVIRQVMVGGERGYFEVNTAHHNHFFLEDTEGLIDIACEELELQNNLCLPEGYEVVQIDVLVRLRPRMDKQNSVSREDCMAAAT